MMIGRLHAVAIRFLYGHGAMGFIPNAYIIARKGPHVSVGTFCTVSLITKILSIIFMAFICCIGLKSHILY